MDVFVVSDLHIGSPHCRHAEVRRFLAGLPAGATLVLNGDILDHPGLALPDEARATLDALQARAADLRAFWVYGNHDPRERLPPMAGFEYGDEFTSAEGRLLAVHGDDFHGAGLHHRWFAKLFRCLYRCRLRLGAQPMHVAQYAKRFPFFYRVLRNTVAANAVGYARAKGGTTIVCGHVHFAEERRLDGVRYFNTGAWTEAPSWYLHVNGDTARLVKWGEDPGQPS
ncbi:MAG: Calcineurin-like phosphoesterase superfamily domain protein [Lentisphaerae bacterium ADurb.BinA184]|nr:MAG: Calcineurin-like phosphoesterase superfamily domain protein [Lentisphaerae bacterium ADurb.BinA184]